MYPVSTLLRCHHASSSGFFKDPVSGQAVGNCLTGPSAKTAQKKPMSKRGWFACTESGVGSFSFPRFGKQLFVEVPQASGRLLRYCAARQGNRLQQELIGGKPRSSLK